VIGTLNENTLHNQLKHYCCVPDALLEYKLKSGYVADVFCARDAKIIEIQTANFANMKRKLEVLTKTYYVELVYPISVNTLIRTLNADGTERSLNKSPLHGHLFQVCEELKSISSLLANKNLSIRLMFIESLTTKIDDKKGRSRFKNPRIINKELIAILKEEWYPTLQDLAQAILATLPERFSTKDVIQKGYKRRVSRFIWFYKSLNLIEECEKVGRVKIYKKVTCKSE